jgi:hypothetical protein
LLPLAVLAVLALAIVALAGPVGTSSGFEDDDANLDVNSTFDWNGFSPVTWTGDAPYREAAKSASGWDFKGLEDDEEDTADTAFAGGTKQDDNCANVVGAKAPNKDDLKRAYFSTKTIDVPSDTTNPKHTILNLAWLRIPQNTTSSSAHVGFEFNKGSTACGGSAGAAGLVARSAGDMLIVYDFEGGSGAPVLTLRRWVTSGACEVGSSSPPCWGPATNLTAGGIAEGAVNVGSPTDDDLAPGGSDELGDSEFGEAGIDLTKAGIFTGSTCESFGNVLAVSRSSGNSAKAQMKDLVGPGAFTIGNCGKVIIRKVTSPAGDTTTSFSYTTNVTTLPASTTSPFSLKDGESNTIDKVVAGSGLTVTEGNPSPLYALTSIDCSASTVPAANRSTNTTTRTVTFTLGVGQTLDCTFTNTKQVGALKIVKQSTKSGNPLVKNAGAVFSYKVTGSSDTPSSISDNGTGDGDSDIGEVCVSGLAVGSYTVNETSPPSGYGDASQSDLTATVVAGTNCGANPPGAGATVTFTNPPLADIQVRFKDGGSGETALTAAGITCSNSTGTSSTADTAGWDDTKTVTGIEAPATITCTIPIDP